MTLFHFSGKENRSSGTAPSRDDDEHAKNYKAEQGKVYLSERHPQAAAMSNIRLAGQTTVNAIAHSSNPSERRPVLVAMSNIRSANL